jgi:5'(3')-deoxyribonucleotidase
MKKLNSLKNLIQNQNNLIFNNLSNFDFFRLLQVMEKDHLKI